jgi:hypothetical protein
MEIFPISPLKIVDPARHEDHELPERRQPPRKKEKIAPRPVYTPDGHVEENGVSKIDIVA